MADPNVNTRAEVMANVRNKALDDAIEALEKDNAACTPVAMGTKNVYIERIRRLKKPEPA